MGCEMNVCFNNCNRGSQKPLADLLKLAGTFKAAEHETVKHSDAD